VKFGVLCCANLCGSWNLEGLVLLGVGAVKQGAILWTRGVRSVGEKKKKKKRQVLCFFEGVCRELL
jgi:hypothetical protein